MVVSQVAIGVAVGSLSDRSLSRSRLDHDFCNGSVMGREALEVTFVSAVSDVPTLVPPGKRCDFMQERIWWGKLSSG